MAEDTRTQTLITDEDVEAFGKARYGPTGWPDPSSAISDLRRFEMRAELEEIVPGLRARWVAEALEEIAADGSVTAPWAGLPGRLRLLAAEYRAGAR